MAGHDDGQTYLERPPDPALAGVLSSAWVQRVEPGASPYRHRTIPNGSIELSCRIGAAPRVTGPQSVAAEETLEAGATIVGVRFHPGAGSAVLGLPATELVDLAVAADDVLGRAGSELGERVADAAAIRDATALLERHVASRLADGAAPLDPVVAEAVRRLMPWRAPDVGSLPGALHISERQLRRRCQAAVGFPPKVLHRMLRFQGFLALAQEALARGRSPGDDGLALLAAEAGYADQPHLTRECLRLTGVSPRELLRDAEHHCGGNHDHRASFLPLLRPRDARLAVSFKP